MAFLSRLSGGESIQQEKDFSEKIRRLMQLCKYDRAIKMLETMLDQNCLASGGSGLDLDVLYQYYGECLVQSSRLAEAIEILSKGMALAPTEECRCKETLEELAIPAIEKHILECADVEEACDLVHSLKKISFDKATAALKNFLFIAEEHYKLRDYSKAAAAYEQILPMAEQLGCLDYEDLLRAGDSYLKCKQLNKAWKLYQNAAGLADTYSKECRLHKKIADLLIIRNQDWHAIFHFLIALQAVPSDKGARSKMKRTLKKLGIEKHLNRFLQLNAKHSDRKQLERSLMDLRKQLKAS